MLVRLVEGEGPAYEGDVLAVIEARLEPRIAVGPGRDLAIAAGIDAAQDEAPALLIYPMVAADAHISSIFTVSGCSL